MTLSHLLPKFGALALLLFALTASTNAEETGQSPIVVSNAYYKKAMLAEEAGDAATAMAAYKAALKLNPRNANARYKMGQLKRNYKKVAARGREAQFGSVVIPEYKIQGASLNESLMALGTLVEKESKGTITPNFVIQDTQGTLADLELTLVLKNIPAGGVLRYLLDQANARVRYDEHAIVIMSR